MIMSMKLGKVVKTGITIYKTIDKATGGKESPRKESSCVTKSDRKKSAKLAALAVLEDVIVKMREQLASIQIDIQREGDEDEEDFQDRCEERREELAEEIMGNTSITFTNGVIEATPIDFNDYDGMLISDLLDFSEEIQNTKMKSSTVAKKVLSTVEKEDYDDLLEREEDYDVFSSSIDGEIEEHYPIDDKSPKSSSLKRQTSPAIASSQSLPPTPNGQVSPTSSSEASANKIACGCTVLIFAVIAGLVMWVINLIV